VTPASPDRREGLADTETAAEIGQDGTGRMLSPVLAAAMALSSLGVTANVVRLCQTAS